MNIQTLYNSAKPRHRVWLLSSDLTAGDEAGTWTLSDETLAATLGDGSELLVMDVPGRLLFWDKENQVAYDWGLDA